MPLNDGRSYVTGNFAIDIEGLAGASADSFVFEPQESREPPGELPVIVADDPGDDDARRLDNDGATGDSGASSMDAAIICLLGDSSPRPKDGSDFFLI